MKGQQGYAIAGAVPRPAVSLAEQIRSIWHRLRRWQQLAAQRRQLAALSNEALKDIGLSRADILEESERPFWDDPLRSR